MEVEDSKELKELKNLKVELALLKNLEEYQIPFGPIREMKRFDQSFDPKTFGAKKFTAGLSFPELKFGAFEAHLSIFYDWYFLFPSLEEKEEKANFFSTEIRWILGYYFSKKYIRKEQIYGEKLDVYGSYLALRLSVSEKLRTNVKKAKEEIFEFIRNDYGPAYQYDKQYKIVSHKNKFYVLLYLTLRDQESRIPVLMLPLYEFYPSEGGFDPHFTLGESEKISPEEKEKFEKKFSGAVFDPSGILLYSRLDSGKRKTRD